VNVIDIGNCLCTGVIVCLLVVVSIMLASKKG